MTREKINIIGNIVLPAVTIAVTIAIFLWLRPEEPTALFYINMANAIWLEGIFFGYLAVAQSKKDMGLSTPFYIALLVPSMRYISANLVWTLAYSLLLTHILPLKIHCIVLIVLTLAWVGFAVITAQTDANYKADTDRSAEYRQMINIYVRKLEMLATGHPEIDRLKEKIRFLPPAVVASQENCQQLEQIIEECSRRIQGGDSPAQQQDFKQYADRTLREINFMKEMAKR